VPNNKIVVGDDRVLQRVAQEICTLIALFGPEAVPVMVLPVIST